MPKSNELAQMKMMIITMILAMSMMMITTGKNDAEDQDIDNN